MDLDMIKDYIYIEDIDGNKIPSWNFVNKIATAENCDACCVLAAAKDKGYKIFKIEAASFCKLAVAAKEIKAEDIYEDYAQYLEGVHSVVYEVDPKDIDCCCC